MAERLGDGIAQIRLPMHDSPLGHINAYLVEDDDGYTLIDCGWKTGDVRAALDAALDELGVPLADVRRLAITHAHYDHYGQAGDLRRAGIPDLLMHPREWAFAEGHLTDIAAFDAASDRWLERNGLTIPPDLDDAGYFTRTELTAPTRTIGDGERVGRLRALATPGHTPGHLCFVDSLGGRMFTGDHILDPITPHVGLWREGRVDPLGDYLASLHACAATAATGVLPAHGEPFPDLHRRVDELLAHEARREAQIVAALHAGASDATAVARAIPWTRRDRHFDDLGDWHRQFAVAETLAHLEHLRVEGAVERDAQAMPIRYRPAVAA